MILDFGENTYNILSGIIGLKFKSQIRNSGIVFKKIFRITELESNYEYYSLITNGETINFKDKRGFVKKFIKYLEENLNELDTQFEELQKLSKNRWIDENQLFEENDEIGHFSYKKSKLLEKMKKIEKTLNNAS